MAAEPGEHLDRHVHRDTIVLGARTPEEVTTNAALWSRPVPEELWEELASEGLLSQEFADA